MRMWLVDSLSPPATKAEGLPDAEGRLSAHARDALCARCAHAATRLRDGRCTPGDACVAAHSGRQIDRFFRRNPETADGYLDDAFWERRAIAVRYAPLAAVLSKMKDPDEVVRRAVAMRLPPQDVGTMRHDADREVRITVAQRMPPDRLLAMAGDPDYMVRMVVARRLPHGKLTRLAQDREREVRKAVAERLPSFALGCLNDDPEPEVRYIVASRAMPEHAARFLGDAEWSVRFAAVARAPLDLLAPLLDDSDSEVRRAVRERLATPEHAVQNDAP